MDAPLVCRPPAPCLSPFSPEIRAGLLLLVEAYDYARRLPAAAWDFAVEIQRLRLAGLTHSTLRWLLRLGYAEHAVEGLLPWGKARSFRPAPNLRFTERTCFILTEPGWYFARALFPMPLPEAPPACGGVAAAQVPRWDNLRLRLSWDDRLVKEFKGQAPNQITILTAFEEEGWPPRIDDPIPPRANQDPQRRLLDTIYHLNLRQKCPLIRFLGDGTGQGVRWEYKSSGRPS